nr:efflux pump roqt [Quercus suber]
MTMYLSFPPTLLFRCNVQNTMYDSLSLLHEARHTGSALPRRSLSLSASFGSGVPPFASNHCHAKHSFAMAEVPGEKAEPSAVRSLDDTESTQAAQDETRQPSNVSSVKEASKEPTDAAAVPGGKAGVNSETSRQESARVLVVLIAVFTCMFLVALDRTIISTAIPQITEDFQSLSSVGWYGSAYLLACCAFQLLFGKLYSFFSVKGTFLGSLLIFEVASAICGAAPNSIAFIIGRAISGVGAAGIFAGTIVCIIHTMPLHQRPKIQGLFGALFGLASVIGPLIGGAFTSNVTWRWCFYINLPLGGVAAVMVFFFLQIPERDATKQPLMKKLSQLDVLGSLFLIPSIVCLLLALQWGGQTYSILFGTTATLPPRIFKYRSVVAAFWMTLTIGSANYILRVSSVQSGIRLLPLMLAMVLGSMGGGFTTTKIGYYNPYAIVGSCIMSVGAGLITTFNMNTSEGVWIGYQILFGFGLGLSFQTPNLAVQNTLPKQDVPIGLALMLFGQLLGAAIFVSVGENVLGNQLVSRLSGIPGFDSSQVTSAGATTIIDSVPANDVNDVLIQYNASLQVVFMAGLIVACLTLLGAVALEWKPIKKPGPPPKSSGDAKGPGPEPEKKV